jgi:uroporphyrinogen-III synthase
MMSALPLAGLRVAVTRPRDQSGALAQAITEAGGQPILFPLLEIGPPADPRPLREAAARLDRLQLLIFISPTAVHHGMPPLLAHGPLPGTLRVAAVGQGSAAALRKLGVSAVLAPTDRFDSEHLLALDELNDVAGWRIAIFRGENGRELLGDTLKARGAQVEYIPCYRRLKPAQGADQLLAERPDMVTVTSSEALGYLWEMADETTRAQLIGLPLLAPHERIAAAARALGWREALATEGGDAGLLAGLKDWAARRPQ